MVYIQLIKDVQKFSGTYKTGHILKYLGEDEYDYITEIRTIRKHEAILIVIHSDSFLRK